MKSRPFPPGSGDIGSIRIGHIDDDTWGCPSFRSLISGLKRLNRVRIEGTEIWVHADDVTAIKQIGAWL